MHPMRRKDREVTDPAIMREVIEANTIVRLGFYDSEDPDFPYIVPMNYAPYFDGENIWLIMHGAKAGRRAELLEKTRLCSFEIDGDLMYEVVWEEHDVTQRFRSIIGKGEISLAEGDDKIRALQYVVDRDERSRGLTWNPKSANACLVPCLRITDMSCKQSLPGTGGD